MAKREYRLVSEEKKANVRSLYAGGMSRSRIATICKMGQRTVDRIVADIPDPHQGRAQQVFTSLHNTKRLHGNGLLLLPTDFDD